MSRYVRTMMKLDDGTYTSARIDTTTGEVRPYKYKSAPPMPKARPKLDAPDTEPFWMAYIDSVGDATRETDRVPTKSIQNPYYGLLDSYDTYELRSGGVGKIVSAQGELSEDELDDAICSLADNLPFMDDYFTGVAHLGNYNPLSKNVMFHLLRTLPEITSKSIYEATHYNMNYCARLATALRVFIKLTT